MKKNSEELNARCYDKAKGYLHYVGDWKGPESDIETGRVYDEYRDLQYQGSVFLGRPENLMNYYSEYLIYSTLVGTTFLLRFLLK